VWDAVYEWPLGGVGHTMVPMTGSDCPTMAPAVISPASADIGPGGIKVAGLGPDGGRARHSLHLERWIRWVHRPVRPQSLHFER